MRCRACGRPITTRRRTGVGITLQHVWVHYSWWANRTHAAIPEE